MNASGPTSEQVRQADAVVVGAGLAGLYMLHRLRDMGLSVICVDRSHDVGGTWLVNRYPGARVDTLSLNYSYGFDELLQQEWVWTERFARQPELLAYLRHVADRFDLRRDIMLETSVVAAAFDEEALEWTVATDRGPRIRARFLISAAGVLSASNVPDFPGLASFEGTWAHTSRWPEKLDVAGKRVGVIGTGSTGVQIIPELAREAGHLVVFQRTANYCVGRKDGALTPEMDREWKASYPQRRLEARYATGGSSPAIRPTDVDFHELSDEQRNGLLERAWALGSPRHLVNTFKDVMRDPVANEYVCEFVRNKIRGVVNDTAVAELLCPTDHYFATKRPVLENGYYQAYNRPNVTLVDVKSDPIERIVPRGIRTTAGDYDLDVLILATGFDAITGPLLRLGVVGREGQRLSEAWGSGPATYLGMATTGFPNFFFVAGPGSPSVLGNVVTSIELHVEWVSGLIDYMRTHGYAAAEPTPAAQSRWTAHVADAASETLYGRANSWFLGANVPGKPRVFLPYVGGVGNYRRACEKAMSEGFPGLAFTSSGDLAEAERTAAVLT